MYPGCGLFGAFGGTAASTYVPYAPFQILHGDSDPLYTAGACQARHTRAQLLSEAANFRAIVHYEGARHSFDGCSVASGSCSAADVTAKAAADTAAMRVFDTEL